MRLSEVRDLHRVIASESQTIDSEPIHQPPRKAKHHTYTTGGERKTLQIANWPLRPPELSWLNLQVSTRVKNTSTKYHSAYTQFLEMCFQRFTCCFSVTYYPEISGVLLNHRSQPPRLRQVPFFETWAPRGRSVRLRGILEITILQNRLVDPKPLKRCQNKKSSKIWGWDHFVYNVPILPKKKTVMSHQCYLSVVKKTLMSLNLLWKGMKVTLFQPENWLCLKGW